MPSWKDTVRVATTGANINLSGTQTIDGVALAIGDRVLVKDQTNASQNGIYIVASAAWSRAADANTSALIGSQIVVRVSDGTVNGGVVYNTAGTEWLLVTTGPITLGTTNLYFVRSDLLRLDRFGDFSGFSGHAMADVDIFAISNYLQDGQSDKPLAYLAASIAGYGGICTGLRGRNGNGSSVQPNVGAGVYADSDNGYGVFAASASNDAIHAESQSNQHAGVSGINNSGTQAGKGGPGVYGFSKNLDGVQGWSQSSANAGVSARNTAGGIAVWAQAKTAGVFDGDVVVTGDFKLNGGDCAEHFDVVDAARCEPGTVMAIDDSGALVLSCREYDRRVAGVVSGAGGLRPGLFLDHKPDSTGRLPIALVGKVCCKAVTQGGPIAVGDLLTTSALPGHAMKASDPSRAFGAVIGKALEPLPSGVGLIRVLIALQ